MTRTRARQLGERRAQRRTEAADVLHRLRVVDRKAAADVERVEARRASRARAAAMQLRAGLERLDVLGGIRGLRADVERQPAHLDAQVGRQRAPAPAGPPDRSRTCATGRTPRPGRGTTRAAAARPAPRWRANLRTSSGLSATKVRTPKSSALRMSCSRLMGWVWMQRSGATPRRCTSCTSPVVARSRKPPSAITVCTTAGCGMGFSA